MNAIKKNIQIKFKAYESQLIDQVTDAVLKSAKAMGAIIRGPIVLPTKREEIVLLRSDFIYKESKERFIRKTHKRLLLILNPDKKTIRALERVVLASGVNVSIKIVG